MANIIWSEPSLSDLDAIADYIALDNIRAAQRFVKKVFSDVEKLANFPESGRIPPELEGSKYREIIVAPCRIFYRIAQEKVYILYVMRSERSLRRYLIEDRSQKYS
jgi:toxin ParE1/3/4